MRAGLFIHRVLFAAAATFIGWITLSTEKELLLGNLDGEDKLVRLPRTERSSLNIEKEIALLPNLGPQLPISTPKIVGEGLPDASYPFPWLVCEWLDGSNPDQAGMVDDCAAATDLAAFVKSMQSIQPVDGPRCRRGGPLIAFTEEVQQSIPQLEGLYDLNALQALWELISKVPQWGKAPVWIHGDLHPGNLIAKDKHIVGIVDFGMAGIGDPACDLMVAWTLLKEKGRDTFRSLVEPDENTWQRGRGWAFFLGVVGYPYYRSTNPIFASIAKNALDEVICDHEQSS